MAMPNDIQRRGLRPDVSNERVFEQRITSRGDLGARIQELASVLDPTGNGAMAQYLRRKDEDAVRAATAAFQHDNEVTEVAIVQANPHLFGTSKVIGRSLSHMRGSQSGREAIQAARVTAVGTGLDRQPPEQLAEWLETERMKSLDSLGLDSDGQRAFNHSWASYSRQLVDMSLPKHIDAMEDEYRAAGSADNATEFDFAHTIKQYDHLPEAFAARLNSATLLGRDRGTEELLILDDYKTHLAENPAAGAGAIEALIDAGVFVGSEAKLEAANLKSFAAKRKLDAEEADVVANEQKSKAMLNDVTSQLLNAVGNGPEAVAQLLPKLQGLDSSVASDGMTVYSKSLELAKKHEDHLLDEGALIDLERRIIFDPSYDVNSLLAEGNLTREALKRGNSAIQARDKGLAGVFSFASVKRGFDRLENQPSATADFAGGAVADPERVRLYQEAIPSVQDMMWQWAKTNPEAAMNAELAGRQMDVYTEAVIKDIDSKRPPPKPELGTAAGAPIPEITGTSIARAVLERERTFLAERGAATNAAVSTGSITARHPNADGVWTRAPIISLNTDMLMSAAMGFPGTFESITPPAPPAPTSSPAEQPAPPAESAAAQKPTPAETSLADEGQSDDELERVYGPGTAAGVRAVGRFLKQIGNPIYGTLNSKRS